MKAATDGADFLGVDRDSDGPVGKATLAHLEDQGPRNQRLRQVCEEVIEFREAVATDLQDVAKSLGDEERRLGSVTLHDRIQCERRAVEHKTDPLAREILAFEQRSEAGQDRRRCIGPTGGVFENAG